VTERLLLSSFSLLLLRDARDEQARPGKKDVFLLEMQGRSEYDNDHPAPGKEPL
jgi:hypothetical protein